MALSPQQSQVILLSPIKLLKVSPALAPHNPGENREGPHHKEEHGAAAQAEDSPVCDSQILFLINQAQQQQGFMSH